MASGLGRRFGGNKLLAKLNGKPLAAWILDATEGIFAHRVVVTRHDEIVQLCTTRGVEVIRHDLPYRSDTVRLGVQALQGGENLKGILFCSGDQPLLRRESIQAILQAAESDSESILQAAWQGTIGAPMLFPAWAFEELQHLPQGKGGNVIAKKNPERVRFVEVQEQAELKDVDCPEDLEELERYLEQKERNVSSSGFTDI